MDGEEVTIAGWVHEVRDIGKIIFLLIRDHTGIAQVTAKRNFVSDEIMTSLSLQKESVIMVKGKVKQNKESRRGFEIIPEKVTNLNPLSAPIPFEVTGKVPADLDVRLDNRYIDLRRPEVSSIFNIESTVLCTFREMLLKENFQEIRTPSIVEAATEGGADLFSLSYFEQKAYLAQSPQLYKQLAVIGGMDRIFMIVPVFRAEKSNTIFHLNEITQMDVEIGFAGYEDAIELLKKVAEKTISDVADKNIDDLEILGTTLPKTSAVEATYSKVISKLNDNGIKIEFGEDLKREHEEEACRLLGDLLIIKEYPTSVRAFYSMPNEKDPELCNSFDLIYKGLEISSGAQRIHLPNLLISALKKKGLDPSSFDFYIDAFRKGAPPHAGWSIGLERFTMKLTGSKNIRECALFPRDRHRLKP